MCVLLFAWACVLWLALLKCGRTQHQLLRTEPQIAAFLVHCRIVTWLANIVQFHIAWVIVCNFYNCWGCVWNKHKTPWKKGEVWNKASHGLSHMDAIFYIFMFIAASFKSQRMQFCWESWSQMIPLGTQQKESSWAPKILQIYKFEVETSRSDTKARGTMWNARTSICLGVLRKDAVWRSSKRMQETDSQRLVAEFNSSPETVHKTSQNKAHKKSATPWTPPRGALLVPPLSNFFQRQPLDGKEWPHSSDTCFRLRWLWSQTCSKLHDICTATAHTLLIFAEEN